MPDLDDLGGLPVAEDEVAFGLRELEPASWLLRGDDLRARFRSKDTLLPSDN